MRYRNRLPSLVLVGVLSAPTGAFAQGNAAHTPPPDPWPRVINLAEGQVLVYQPQVNKVLRTVTFEDLRISKIDFPTLSDNGATYATELQRAFAKSIRTISLD